MTPHFLVLSGDGINCERETALAFEAAGGKASIWHCNTLLKNPRQIHDFDGLALPGGFSFGDALGAGQILALKLRHQMQGELQRFIQSGAPIIGICNGFQVLVRMGLLPDIREERILTLAPNQSGRFLNRWVGLHRPAHAVCKWTMGLNKLELPVRHAEGRVLFARGQEQQCYQRLWEKGQIALEYTEDVNGSYGRIAALTDRTGLILGLMPHPEGYLFQATHPKQGTRPARDEGTGLQLFRNIVEYCRHQR